ncbi:hypothetical protein XH84_14920 [Bradyrhizobium nanningense]|nr:hypothetical protein XH84_14920 [Bradyrhizobium nanningense]
MYQFEEGACQTSAAICTELDAIELNHFHISGALGMLSLGEEAASQEVLPHEASGPHLSGAATGVASIMRSKCRRQSGRAMVKANSLKRRWSLNSRQLRVLERDVRSAGDEQ